MREKIICAIPFVLLLLAVGFIGGAENAERIVTPCICAFVCLVLGIIVYTGIMLRDDDYYYEDEDGDEQ